MAVTKQVYTLSPTWNASGLASLFRSAFIDAGLMTEWYDAFLSGSVENRIVEVVNDGTKTYGTVYYWFMFTTAGVSVHTALSWNATTHVPTGTQYQNYFDATTNATTNHDPIYTTLVTTTTFTLTRYTSAVNTSCTWFVLRQSASVQLLIPFGAYTATSFVDQNRTAFNGLTLISGQSVNNFALMSFAHHGGLLTRYGTIGRVSNAITSNTDETSVTTWLPTALTETHTGLAANYSPVFTSIQCTPYLPALPADFGLTTYYASNSVVVGDTFIVSAGTEEYEVIYAGLPISNFAAILFLARTV